MKLFHFPTRELVLCGGIIDTEASTGTPKLISDEIVKAGEEIYSTELRSGLEADNLGRFVALDVVSRDYRVGDEHLATVDALRAARRDAVVYTKIIGNSALFVMGGRMKREDGQILPINRLQRESLPSSSSALTNSTSGVRLVGIFAALHYHRDDCLILVTRCAAIFGLRARRSTDPAERHLSRRTRYPV
jgi:hypothetical protein